MPKMPTAKKRRKATIRGAADPAHVEGQEPSQATQDAGEAIFVRIKQPLFKLVDDYSRDFGSKKYVIEKIIEYFQSASKDEQKAILGGGKTLGLISDLLAAESWSNHAFGRHWSWAVSRYNILKKTAGNSGRYSTFAEYRESYAWIQFGGELRSEAYAMVKEKKFDKWKRNMTAARHCVERMIRCIDKPNDPEFDIPPVHFNRGCGYSRLAMLTVESSLREDAAWTTKLAEAVVSKSLEDEAAVWESIGSKWRGGTGRDYFRTEVGEDQVDEFSQKAMHCLRKMKSCLEIMDKKDDTRVLWPSIDFFKHYARDDPDTLFLRSDSTFKMEFNEWATQDEQEEDWLYGAYERLVQGIRS